MANNSRFPFDDFVDGNGKRFSSLKVVLKMKCSVLSTTKTTSRTVKLEKNDFDLDVKVCEEGPAKIRFSDVLTVIGILVAIFFGVAGMLR